MRTSDFHVSSRQGLAAERLRLAFPGAAVALSKVLAGDDAQFSGGRYRPNERVYRMILDAGEE